MKLVLQTAMHLLFFSMLKEFEIHFNKEVIKPNEIRIYEENLQMHKNLYKEYKLYGF